MLKHIHTVQILYFIFQNVHDSLALKDNKNQSRPNFEMHLTILIEK